MSLTITSSSQSEERPSEWPCDGGFDIIALRAIALILLGPDESLKVKTNLSLWWTSSSAEKCCEYSVGLPVSLKDSLPGCTLSGAAFNVLLHLTDCVPLGEGTHVSALLLCESSGRRAGSRGILCPSRNDAGRAKRREGRMSGRMEHRQNDEQIPSPYFQTVCVTSQSGGRSSWDTSAAQLHKVRRHEVWLRGASITVTHMTAFI